MCSLCILWRVRHLRVCSRSPNYCGDPIGSSCGSATIQQRIISSHISKKTHRSSGISYINCPLEQYLPTILIKDSSEAFWAVSKWSFNGWQIRSSVLVLDAGCWKIQNKYCCFQCAFRNGLWQHPRQYSAGEWYSSVEMDVLWSLQQTWLISVNITVIFKLLTKLI